MRYVWIQLAAAYFGSLGFALLIGNRFRHLFFAAFGGMLTWGCYLAIHWVLPSIFLANLCASIVAVCYSEAFAHWHKCPAVLFLVPGIIPLVPGGTLYETMKNAVEGELSAANACGRETLICALAIAAGIGFGTVLRKLSYARKQTDSNL